MQNKFILTASEDTPAVTFDMEGGVFSIKGRSYPEDAREFYKPISAWLTDYSTHPNPNTTFEVDLEYINSGSVKEVFRLLYLIEDIMETGNEAKVIWTYGGGDELMHQKGLEFQKFLEVPVELRER